MTWVVLFAPFSAAAAHSRDHRQHALAAAQAAAAHRKAEVVQANAKAAGDAARAAMLAQQQVAAASALRHLEDQTATAAATLAALDSQSQNAAISLQRNEAALAALLPIMQRLAGQPAATMLAIPESPADAIRGILVLQGIAAKIEAEAKTVHAQAEQVAILQRRALVQQTVLLAAVAGQQQAENALSAQIAAAHDAETRDLDTAAHAAAAALAANRNVQNVQTAIGDLQANATAPANNAIAPGGAPVAGAIVQAYGAPTVAGPAVGIVYRAAPGARVAAPCSGPVLYANQFQSYGLLIILDCGDNYAAVLSGMRHLDVTAGQMLARGQPVGEMQGFDASNPARQPMLYIELRRNGTPVDPTAWLRKGGSG